MTVKGTIYRYIDIDQIATDNNKSSRFCI